MLSSAVDKMNSTEECRGDPEQKENTAFFLWRGRHSSVSGRDTAAFLSIGTNKQGESQVRPSEYRLLEIKPHPKVITL